MAPPSCDEQRLADRGRRQGLIGFILLVVVSVVGALLAHHHGVDRIDGYLAGRIGSDPGSAVLEAVADLGNPPIVAAVAVIAAGFALARRRDVVCATTCLVGPALAGFLTEFVFKPLVDSPAVPLSYPSGHTTGVAALVSVLVLAVSRGRKVTLVLGTLLVAASCVAVVALGWHTPTEAVAGGLVGSGATLLAGGVSCAVILRHRAKRERSSVAARSGEHT